MQHHYPPTEIATFRADDTIVEIIPDFDLPTPLRLLSSSIAVGPFKAGISTKVPLWMALVLVQRSLARIVPPSWLTLESLTTIIAYERREISLFHDETRLPRDYYELSQRLLIGTTNHHSTSTNHYHHINPDAIALLIQDLLAIRLDKLRQQFQSLVYEHAVQTAASGDDVVIQVNGIGTYELAILHDFVTQALADKSFLEEVVVPTSSSSSSTVTTTTTTTTTNDNADRPDQQQQQQVLLPQAIRKSTAPLRKFRTGRK